MTERTSNGPDADEQEERGQVSEAGSALGDSETATGGADAVPDTPDANPGHPEPIAGD